MQNYAKIGIFGILALVALRVTIGWHFYMEGVAKVRGQNFSSEGFLASAQGPLAENFQSMIWDNDGRFRLNEEEVIEQFDQAAKRATNHFGFTEDQRTSKLEPVRKQYINKLKDVYAAADEDVYKYWESVERVARMKEAPAWNQVTSLRGQRTKIESELLAAVRPTLESVDAIWKQYEGRLNSIADPNQLQQAGEFHFERPGESVLSAGAVDRIIPIFDMCVGILLIIGLLTPVAAWAAALFLLGVVLSQMPGYAGTQPTYFQAVEAVALVVLATTDAGRYAGLDFIPWAWWTKRKSLKAATAAA